MTTQTAPNAKPTDAGPTSLTEDLLPPLTKLQAMAESSRCFFCYEAPCVAACPTTIDIPGFIRRLQGGNVTGAAKKILEANSLGGTCARACPTEILCEAACVRNKAEGRPVVIGRLQRFAVDGLLAADVQPFTRAAATGKTIAVIGAGPAGLACAHRLARAGHQVTIFDARTKAGGLNEYGLAAYKMADAFAQKEIAFILAVGGITIETGKRLGADLDLETLRQSFDAVFIGTGLAATRTLGVPGEDLDRVEDAIAFIERLRQDPAPGTPLKGRRVVVIGGGNTAVDAAIQAKLLGAMEVTIAYRRGRETMGATHHEQALAQTAGVVIRTWLAPRRVVSDGADGVDAVEFEHRPEGPAQTVVIPADLVLKAVGQVLDTVALAGLPLANGRIVTDAEGRTGLKGVYAGGDCTAGGLDLTVRAVADGQRAAAAITADFNA